MSTPSKRKGSNYERDVVAWLIGQGVAHAERRQAGSRWDKGDINGIPGVVIECKNQAATQLGSWVDELKVEMDNAHTSMGVVVHKRRGVRDVGQHFATAPVSVWFQLLKEAGYL